MDGTTHINIYSKGKTELGRRLSNFSYSPIDTVDGKFDSIEGYWYWLGLPFHTAVGAGADALRTATGNEAKKLGRSLGGRDWSDAETFKLKIYAAMLNKLLKDRELLSDFISNKLPFRHYYIFAGRIVEPKEGKWIIDMWTFLQEQLCTSSK